MTHLKYKRLFGWFAVAIMLLTTSCKDELFGGTGNSDEVTVSFALAPEAAAVSTRAVYEDNEHQNLLSHGNISDGSLIDMLVYAIYDEKGILLEHYEGESDEIGGFTPGDGQTIKKIDKFPCTITLTLKRGEKYTVAFWAQSSKCNVYDTENLRKVEMIYNNVPNNNETLDAFCRSYTFTAGAKDIENPIELYRPLAQINVGTSGFDYEIANRNSSKDYVYTKIRLNRVARYFDVFKDETYFNTTAEGDEQFQGDKTPETFAVVDYDYAKLPAYVNIDIPKYISHTKYDWDYSGDDGSYTLDDGTKDVTTYGYDKEQFLRVHLYDDNRGKKYEKDTPTENINGKDYLGYANLDNYSDHNSETFKYLSMCYVLTSSTKTEPITLNNVKAWIATDVKGTDSIEIVNLNNVPVQRNWRTNIIGNLMTDENSFIVKLDKDFAGEFNGIYNGETAKWTGSIVDGVYYDGEADEIQISNANGLLWFQRMVNGTIKVRETHDGNHIGENYLYYEPTNQSEVDYPNNKTEKYLSYNGIPMPDDAELKERILVATHQKWNDNSKKDWPENGNFHFTGTKDGKDYPATVRLMADIDMSGVEWIPIGFDGRIFEQLNNEFNETDATNRGFYGKFDGNHHTVSNLTTKRFGTCIPDDYMERNAAKPAERRYWDALQWFGRGFFGEVGGYAEIRNLSLRNVDFKGCQGVGGIVGIVSGKAVKIENCIVDGGSIEVTPLYRCDKIEINGNPKNRTFARGVYLGGIVGYFYNTTDQSKVTNCEVRNLTMRGYRRLGGIIGSLDLSVGKQPTAGSKSVKGNISGNSIVNSILIASQFNVFGIRCAYEDGVYKTGFGWDKAEYDLLTQEFIGGDEKDPGKGNNSSSNFTLSRFTEHIDNGNRLSEMEGAPLKYMPLLSSWYTDDITLQNNYYGEPSAKKISNLAKFIVYSNDKADPNQEYVNYNFPMNIPYDVDIMWANDVTNPNVGLYVESVTLDGADGVGGRSVITPTKVDEKGACALFVTARDRKQFYDGNNSNSKSPADKTKVYYQAPTILKNIVVRGQPYAHTGIMLSPNENMDKIELNTVAVYDVYQTLAMNNHIGGTNQWPNVVDASQTDLKVVNCNLRGYTVPGAGWKSINYSGTTFEKGKDTGHGDNEKTYKAESATTFTKCFFKAPYIIEKPASVTVYFGNDCYATAASVNMKIEPENTNWTRIEIDSDSQGRAKVIYIYGNGTQSVRRK